MKKSREFFVITFLVLSYISVFSQNNAKLYLVNNKLVGICENKYFTGFEIELDSTYSKIDSTILFKQFPRIGKLNFKNKFEVPTEFTITERAGFPQVMFRFRSDYLTFDDLKIENQFISFSIDEDPEVPATENDLRIIETAKKLLSQEKFWNNKDDRKCDDDLANKSFSLYCALRISSLEIEEKYNHRNLVLQKFRQLVNQKYPNRKWNHRLMDFNNMDETNYKDIVNMLNEIEQFIIKELSNNE